MNALTSYVSKTFEELKTLTWMKKLDAEDFADQQLLYASLLRC